MSVWYVFTCLLSFIMGGGGGGGGGELEVEEREVPYYILL